MKNIIFVSLIICFSITNTFSKVNSSTVNIESQTKYSLIGTAVLTVPDPRVRYFEISIEGNFILGFSQFIIKINRDISNAVIGIENFDSSIAHQVVTTSNEIRFGILPYMGIMINGKMRLASLRLSSSENISDIYFAWKNSGNPFTTQLTELINNQMVLITDTNSHYVNNLTGINETIQPVTFKLNQNYPNPFNPTTIISYQLPQTELVNLIVFDALGKLVAHLVNEKQVAGSYEAKLDGSQLSSGHYFYRLTAGVYNETKQMQLIK